jgi:arginase
MKAAHIIGAPLDLGGGRRGVDMGPSALRIAGLGERIALLGYTVVDRGDLPTPIPETREQRDERKKYIREIAKVCQRVYQLAVASFDDGAMPIVIGGDHSIAAGSVAAAAEWARKTKGLPIGLLWVDAHGDMNTPATSPSGNVHGMPLAIALGLADEERFRSECWPLPMIAESSTVLIGVRSVDEGERRRMAELGLRVFTMHDIDRYGMHRVVEEAIELTAGGPFVHISFDMDVVDPDQAPGVGTPVRGGITYREAHLAMELVAKHGILTSLEIVEVNPVLDEHNQTASLAVELACSALGARIL